VLNAGLGGTRLPKETAVLVSIHNIQERLEALNLQVWLVPVPLQIAAHPENTPPILRSHKCSLRNGVFHRLFRILPIGANFEYLDALPGDSAPNIELRPDVRRRTTTLQELRKVALATRSLEIGQRHGSAQIGGVQRTKLTGGPLQGRSPACGTSVLNAGSGVTAVPAGELFQVLSHVDASVLALAMKSKACAKKEIKWPVVIFGVASDIRFWHGLGNCQSLGPERSAGCI